MHKFVYSTKLDFETFSLIAAADAAATAELRAADADAGTKGGGNTLRMSHLLVCLTVCVCVFPTLALPTAHAFVCVCVCVYGFCIGKCCRLPPFALLCSASAAGAAAVAAAAYAAVSFRFIQS